MRQKIGTLFKALLNVFKKIIKLTPKIIDDILLIAGVIFIFYGVWAIYKPAGYITLGLCLVAMACLIASRQ